MKTDEHDDACTHINNQVHDTQQPHESAPFYSERKTAQMKKHEMSSSKHSVFFQPWQGSVNWAFNWLRGMSGIEKGLCLILFHPFFDPDVLPDLFHISKTQT